MEHKYPTDAAAPHVPDPAALSLIERIWWTERGRIDPALNEDRASRDETGACFRSWALPDYLKK